MQCKRQKNFEDFQHHVLNEVNVHFTIIGVTETRIREGDSVNLSLMPELPGYRFEFVPTPLAAAGVGLFIDENVKYRIAERVTNSSYQALWIEFQQSNDKKNMCGIVYRQDNDANEFLDYLSESLEQRQLFPPLNKTKVRDYSNFNAGKFMTDLCEIDWNNTFRSSDVNNYHCIHKSEI